MHAVRLHPFLCRTIFFLSTACMGIVALVLLASPKGEPPPPPPFVSAACAQTTCMPKAVHAAWVDGCVFHAVISGFRMAACSCSASIRCLAWPGPWLILLPPASRTRLQGYDNTIIPLVVIMTVVCLGICVGGCGVLRYFVLPPVYARPLSYHLDIEPRT